jgi:hypothetical protein
MPGNAEMQARLYVPTLALLIASPMAFGQAAPSSPNEAAVTEWKKRIAGRENEPAERVFKNVQFMKTARASVFLTIMDGGFCRALGVTCSYCHVEGDFSSDEKRTKRAAREIQSMHRMINQQLAKMENLQTDADRRAISCILCHRGEAIPRQ